VEAENTPGSHGSPRPCESPIGTEGAAEGHRNGKVGWRPDEERGILLGSSLQRQEVPMQAFEMEKLAGKWTVFIEGTCMRA
jgi:hypothetical protein